MQAQQHLQAVLLDPCGSFPASAVPTMRAGTHTGPILGCVSDTGPGSEKSLNEHVWGAQWEVAGDCGIGRVDK